MNATLVGEFYREITQSRFLYKIFILNYVFLHRGYMLLGVKRLMNFKFIAYVNGLLLLILALVLFMTGLTGLPAGGSGGMVFFATSLFTAFPGGTLVTCFWGEKYERVSNRTAYVLTVSSWLSISFFCALPFYWCDLGISFADSVFESISGLTTTGATVLSGLDSMPRDILLWRSLLHFMGGVGIVVMAMAILPVLRIGAMNLFKSESSDVSEKITSRLSHYVKLIVLTYFLITFITIIFLFFAGMSMFDAINHAMAAVATGGFSTHDKSVGFFNSVPIEAILIAAMIAGSLPLTIYVHLFFGNKKNFSFKRYSQIKVFFLILLTATIAVSIWNWNVNGMTFLHAFRVSLFNLTSIMSTTGFATADFAAWGSFATGVFFYIYFIGGCAGSTAGSIKIFRWQLLSKGLYVQFLKNLTPSLVLTIRYEGKIIDDGVLHSVRNFLFLYILTFVFLSLAVMMFNVDFLTSTSAVAQAMGNSGIGLGHIIGPTGNFSNLPSGVKWLLDAAMILGRLELLTVYVLFLPDFWRR